MSRFNKLSHVIWHCQCHIAWVPKYRYRVLKGKIGFGVGNSIENRFFATYGTINYVYGT